MTVGEALERAEALRPGSKIPAAMRQQWLREADGLLRQRLFAKSAATKDYDTVGADVGWQDGLRDDVPLLAPAPFDALYPHTSRGCGRRGS